jgi:hypothetical protein
MPEAPDLPRFAVVAGHRAMPCATRLRADAATVSSLTASSVRVYLDAIWSFYWQCSHAEKEQDEARCQKRRGFVRLGWALLMRAIKRPKSIRWMPWRQEAMKDVVRCDKLR